MPAVAMSHATTEFEFHISPARSSSRPHTVAGTRVALASSRRATAGSSDKRCAPPTAWSRSGIDPPFQQRSSYRNSRHRPRYRLPTAPVQTTPRLPPSASQAGASSMVWRSPSSVTIKAAW
jgi:hypothetical protein